MDMNLVKRELDSCKSPLFFFHDDPDGVCSFLQLYAYIKEGYGVIVKSRPIIDTKFLSKVEQYKPDKIFVLDIAMMEQEFVDNARTSTVWIDHHGLQDIRGVRYINPKQDDPESNPAVSYLTYQFVGMSLWLAAVGTVGDMQWPKELISDFRMKYPDLLPKKIKGPRQATYDTRLGELIRIFSFMLKGTSSEAMKYVKAMTRVNEPYEILDEQNTRGRFILKKYKNIMQDYKPLLKEALSAKSKQGMIVFTYSEDKMSFTSDLANELAYRRPGKVILMGRRKGGEVKCSIRSEKHNLPQMIEKSLAGCTGYGGGHEHASGACVKEEDFERFIEQFRGLL